MFHSLEVQASLEQRERGEHQVKEVLEELCAVNVNAIIPSK